MDMITIDVSDDAPYYIKEGAHINLGAYKFQFHGGMLFIEETEVFAGLVLRPFPVQIFRMAMENPEVSWTIVYPTKEGRIKMETINVYSAKELKETFPEGFERAWDKYKRRCDGDELPWQEEIMGSMKKTFKVAGVTLNNWSIGAYSPCYVKFTIPTYWSDIAETDELVDNYEGQQAVDWLKDTFDLKDARRVEYKNHLGKTAFRWDFSSLKGNKDWDWSCEFTGYCADHDFLESLFECVACDGMNIEDAFRNLADVAGKLFENEYEYMVSEEYFLEEADCNDWKYTEDGTKI